MKLIPNAAALWHRLWSVRLSILSATLGAASFAVQFLAPDHASPVFAAAVFVISIASAWARVVDQPKLRGVTDGDA